jgi:hypothetical protein
VSYCGQAGATASHLSAPGEESYVGAACDAVPLEVAGDASSGTREGNEPRQLSALASEPGAVESVSVVTHT